jgi:hypothetical protein
MTAVGHAKPADPPCAHDGQTGSMVSFSEADTKPGILFGQVITACSPVPHARQI